MCIICTGDYDINLTKLDCKCCNKIQEIPKELVNLIYLNCFKCTNLLYIPKELINLKKLEIRRTKVKRIPKELMNLRHVKFGPACFWDVSWLKDNFPINKIIPLQRYWKLYRKLPTLWKIAEYYTKKRYSPENILKYIELE